MTRAEISGVVLTIFVAMAVAYYDSWRLAGITFILLSQSFFRRYYSTKSKRYLFFALFLLIIWLMGFLIIDLSMIKIQSNFQPN